MTSNRILPVVLVLCASVFGAQSTALAAVGGEVDVLQYYSTNIHMRSSGVYEGAGWVFFHERTPLASKSRFAVPKALKVAMKTTVGKVFGWIDANGGTRTNVLGASHVSMRALVGDFGAQKTLLRRSLSGLPTSVMYRDADNRNPSDFVFDLAVRRNDLLAEAEKGCFDTRTEVVESNWKTVVREQLSGTNRMAFVKSVGAFDLWTLDSELTSGVIEVVVTNGQESACCMKCVDELKNCVRKVGTSAAGEYGRFLDEFKRDVAKESTADFMVCRTNQVGMMIYSYASCLCQPQELPEDAYDSIGGLAAQTDTLDVTIRTMLPVMNRVPACKDCWRVLGEAFLRFGKCHAAMACFRNAIRLDRNDAEVYGLMASAYEKLGYGELATGAAMIAYGLAGGDESMSDVYRILGVKR